MELTCIASIACIIPTTASNEPKFISNTFKPQELNYVKRTNDYNINVQDQDKTLHWNVCNVLTPKTLCESSKEHEELINNVLKGYDVGCLSVSVGNNMYKERRKNMDVILKGLDSKLNALNNVFQIEYAHIGFKDEVCYDFRKRMERSNVSMLERGMDGIMKKVDNIMEIWKNIQNDYSIPTIMTIKLTNLKTNTVGRLVLVDLLHPRFSLLLQKGNSKAPISFSKLLDAVADITTPGKTKQLDLSSCFLTNVIAKFISGHNKLLVFGYINDIMLTEMEARETKFLLDFITSLNGLPVHMMPNPKALNQLENKLFKLQMGKSIQQIEKLQSSLQKLENENIELRKDITLKQDNLVLFDETRAKEVDFLRHALDKRDDLYNCELEQLQSDLERLNTILKEKDEIERENLETIMQIQARNQNLEMTIRHLQDRIQQNQQQNQLLGEQLDHVSNDANHAKNQLKLSQQKTQYLERQLNNLKVENECIETKYDSTMRELNELSNQTKLDNLRQINSTVAKEEYDKLKKELEIKDKLVKNSKKKEEEYKSKIKEKCLELEKKTAELVENYQKKKLKLQNKVKAIVEQNQNEIDDKQKALEKKEISVEQARLKISQQEQAFDQIQIFLKQKLEEIQIKEKTLELQLKKAEALIAQNQIPGNKQVVTKINPSTNSKEQQKNVTLEIKKEVTENSNQATISGKNKSTKHNTSSQSYEDPEQSSDNIIPIKTKEPKILSKVNARRKKQPVSEDDSFVDIEMEDIDITNENASFVSESEIPDDLDYSFTALNQRKKTSKTSKISDREVEESDQNIAPSSDDEFFSEVEIMKEPDTSGKNKTKTNSNKPKKTPAPKKVTTPKRATTSKKATTPKKATIPKKAVTPKKSVQRKGMAPEKESTPEKELTPKKESTPDKDVTLSKIQPENTSSNAIIRSSSPMRDTHSANEDETTRSPILGAPKLKRSPERMINSSQSSKGKKRRKLRNGPNYKFFDTILDDPNEMSPLSKFLQSSDK